MKKKIAIIGTGISGMGAAYLLHAHHDITVYEKNDRIGGHSRTIDVNIGGKTQPVDTGFIVFNDWNYPNLFGLFDHLGVAYEKSDMSFGVSIHDNWLEYSSYKLFAQKRNLLRPQFYGMLLDFLRFNKQALAYIEKDETITLGQCLTELKMGEWFQNYFLLAMGAAIWSCPVSQMMDFPAKTFLRFFKNHGLLSVNNRPQWYTVSGGSREYIAKLTAPYAERVKLDCGAVSVERDAHQWVVTDTQGGKAHYDDVVFACHGDEAAALIQNPPSALKDVIGAFSYQDNHIVVHTDTSFMPKNRDCWASWVYLNDGPKDEKPVVSLTYWMNNLQNFETAEPVLVTLNPGRRPEEGEILDEHGFSHPIFDEAAVKAQSAIERIQGQDGLWFCGAYQRYGFHEDGLLSAVTMCQKMGAPIPWH